MMITPEDLAHTTAAATKHWTSVQLKKLIHDKKLVLLPNEGAAILRVMGLMNRDGSISATNTKKYLQINHLLHLLLPDLQRLAASHRELRVLDACCGNSFVALLVAWYLKEQLGHPAKVHGIDRNEKLIAASQERATALGYESFLSFATGDVGDTSKAAAVDAERYHFTLALHACDVATDYAIAHAVLHKSDVIAVAPCCQRELAKQWAGRGAEEHPLAPILATPQLRWELAASYTDAMRMLLLRSAGYEVIVSEFISSAHTPKNRLLLARRRGAYDLTARRQYESLRDYLGGHPILLEALLGELPT